MLRLFLPSRKYYLLIHCGALKADHMPPSQLSRMGFISIRNLQSCQLLLLLSLDRSDVAETNLSPKTTHSLSLIQQILVICSLCTFSHSWAEFALLCNQSIQATSKSILSKAFAFEYHAQICHSPLWFLASARSMLALFSTCAWSLQIAFAQGRLMPTGLQTIYFHWIYSYCRSRRRCLLDVQGCLKINRMSTC